MAAEMVNLFKAFLPDFILMKPSIFRNAPPADAAMRLRSGQRDDAGPELHEPAPGAVIFAGQTALPVVPDPVEHQRGRERRAIAHRHRLDRGSDQQTSGWI